MAAKYSTNIKSFIASSLIDNVSLAQLNEWGTGVVTAEGDKVFYLQNKYIAKNAGTTGANPPVHVSGTVSDGGVSWIWIESLNENELFKRNVFVFIGKDTEWDDENLPDTPILEDGNESTIINDIITLKRISSSNFKLGAARHDWTSGEIYSQYDNTKNPLATIGNTAYTQPFYVFTDDNQIYKCINNNDDAVSTIKPTSTSTLPFSTADGYVWKYMGTLLTGFEYFLNDHYIPVMYLLTDTGDAQWDVQQAAIPGSISTFNILTQTGSFTTTVVTTVVGGTPTTPAEAYAVKSGNTIKQVLVQGTAQGAGYDLTSEVHAILKSTGKAGSGAEITAITVSNGVITDIDFTVGSNYTDGAIVVLYDPTNTPTTDAEITVTVAPNNTIGQINIVDGGSGYSDDVYGYIIPGTAGAIAKAVFAPKNGHGHNIVTELGANAAIINVQLIDVDDYFLTGNDHAFRQIGLITDVLEKTTLNTAYNTLYIGPNHTSYGDNILNEIDPTSGYILYLNNIVKVVRNIGQVEDIKIILTF